MYYNCFFQYQFNKKIQSQGTAILTLLGGFHPQTQSLWLTDIAHHHLAIAFIFLVAGHMYRTNFGIGHNIKDLLEAHTPPGVDWGVDIRVFMTQSIIQFIFN